MVRETRAVEVRNPRKCLEARHRASVYKLDPESKVDARSEGHASTGAEPAVLSQLGLVPSAQPGHEDCYTRQASGTQGPILGPRESASECYKLNGPNVGAV
jgi:hypothetical protein